MVIFDSFTMPIMKDIGKRSFMQMGLFFIITGLIVIEIAPLTVLFCNCPLFKDISFNAKCLLLWCDEPVITCLVRAIFGINHLRDFWKIRNFKIFKNGLDQLFQITLPNMWLLVLIIKFLYSKLNNRTFVKLGTNEVDVRKFSWNICHIS